MPVISVVSVLIPFVVAVLLFLPQGFLGSFEVSFLPKLNALINTTVSVLLVVGVVLIRLKQIMAHRAVMLSALALSVFFLISYVIYHSQAAETNFGGEGSIRYIYFFVLITHIILATVIVPLALFTVYRAFTGEFHRHKKLARWTFPLWFYVSVTGVVVYLMISPYYS